MSDFEDFQTRSIKLGYNFEEYFVETEDGFIISIHRVRAKKDSESEASQKFFSNETSINMNMETLQQLQKKNPILMGHGLGGSSDTFNRNVEEKSLAYFLARNGYDVFIMNSRGNKYSNQHKIYSREQSEYWDFSFQDMAKYDVPAVANYILNSIYHQQANNQLQAVEQTEQIKLNYIGHSQGCTIILAALSDRSVPSSYFENIVLMTPAALILHSTSPVTDFIQKVDVLNFFQQAGLHSFLQMNSFNYYLCRAIPYICEFSVGITTDSFESPINHDLFYKLMYHYPAGTSTKAYIHFNQLMKAKKFQKFDYGAEKNLAMYNSTQVPEYTLSNIKNKIHILAGTQDIITPLEDIYYLKEQLVNAQNVTITLFNEGHCSFIIGKENEFLNFIPQILA
ncbi:hypothetical protein ABPG72_004755 [Tetrahymena utriculariae]